MCGGGKTQKTTSTQTTKPPQYIEDAYKSLIGRAGGVADTPYSADTERQVAGFAAPQNQAFQNVQNIQGLQNPYIGQAMDYANSGASTISADNIAQYSNPYQQQVIDATMAQIGRNNEISQDQLVGNAALKNALGNSRLGVAQAELARGQDMNTANILANLNSQNYGQALSAAQADKARQFQGASQVAGFGQQAQDAGYKDIASLLGIGSLQQENQQSQYDTATANAQQRAQYPFNTTQWLASIEQGLAPGAGGTTSGVTTQPGPSALSQIAGLGLTAASLFGGGGMFPGVGTTLGTTLSGMFGGSRNLSGLADGGMVGGDLNGDGSVDRIDHLLARLHKASHGMSQIQKSTGGQVDNGFAAGGFPQGEDDNDNGVNLFKDPYEDDDSGLPEIMPSGVVSPQPSGIDAASLIKGFEGYAPKAKWDVRQNSGGYGSRASPGETFTPEKAEAYLQRDMAPVNAWLDANVKVPMTPEQRSALTSFGYNLGTDDLDKLLPDINRGDWQTVAHRALSFNKARNEATGQLETLPGLISRRQKEAGLMVGEMPFDTSAPSAPGASGLTAPVQTAQASIPSATATDANDSGGGWSPNLPLLAAGLGMLASDSPYAGVAIGQGGLKGLEALLNQRKAQAGAQKLADAAKLAQQRLGIQTDALTERKRHNEEVEQRMGRNSMRPVEINGRLVQPQEDGTWKAVYESPPKPAGLMAGDRKEIFEADEAIQAANNVKTSLDQAIKLNDEAYSGPAAQTRGYVTSIFGAKGGTATEELQNVVLQQVLDNLKATFGGQPTEGERQILIEVAGSVNKSPEVRKKIYENAKEAADRRITFNTEKSKALRTGEYFQPGYTPQQAKTNAPEEKSATAAAGNPSPKESIPASASAPPPKAVELLTSNPTPEIITQFDQKYGSGSAKRVLDAIKQQTSTTPFNPATDLIYGN